MHLEHFVPNVCSELFSLYMLLQRKSIVARQWRYVGAMVSNH